eukprot:m.346621 g.346621  ORF g.346621 m.346621 type:complete len:159 (-) comp29628_c0_seq1:32-508(-)
MSGVQIVQRELTPEEMEAINTGFDTLCKEEDVALESTERMGFVALKEGSLIGGLSGLAHKNGEQYSGWFHLTDLFVVKEHRNRGIGSNLLYEMEEKGKELGIHNIWLWTSGPGALRFYDRHGYTQFAEMEAWYSNGSSRIGLRKTIHMMVPLSQSINH